MGCTVFYSGLGFTDTLSTGQNVYISRVSAHYLYIHVAVFFFSEIKQGTLANKASSLAYNFMLAFFPATIFLFTLIPYIPIKNFQDNCLTYCQHTAL